MAHWTVDLNKYCKDKEVEIREVRKAYAFGLYSSIVKKTPYDTGRARANWNVSVGSPDKSETESGRKTPKSKDKMPDPKGDESIYISNNLPYITTLEYGGFPKKPEKDGGKTVNGFSKQAPEGMVGVTLANSEQIFNAAVRSVKK
ncbi:MAG: HK97 gp10 family phage protein [Treponemataceae bacterium]|nr:HK97 gp10 family phage protein [Treponemataceae bacterium]